MLAACPPSAPPAVPPADPLETIFKDAADSLSASAELFESIVRTLETGEGPNAPTLRDWKRKAKKVNFGISKAIRATWSELNRTKLELEILRINAARDIMDERSNMARVLERVRSYASIGEGAVDRALISASSLHSLMGKLANTPETGFHGAAALSREAGCNHDPPAA